MPETNTCKCSQGPHSQPVCEYCDDDWYCPNCGSQITFVTCDSEFPDGSGHVWIYPNDRNEFIVSVSVRYPGKGRSRPPVLRLAECQLKGAEQFFLPELDQFHVNGTEADVSLLLRQHRPETDDVLYPSGLNCELVLVGDFPKKTLNVVVCARPKFKVAISGEKVLRTDLGNQGASGLYFAEVASGELDLEITIKPETAPVFLTDELTEVSTQFGKVDLVRPLKVIEPLLLPSKAIHREPFVCRLHLPEVHDTCELTISLPTQLKTRNAPTGPYSFRVQLKRGNPGSLDFARKEIRIDERHFGERWPNDGFLFVEVKNTEQNSIEVTKLQVIPEEAGRWLSVELDDEKRRFPFSLDKDQRCKLRVCINLAEVTQVESNFAAAICLTDSLARKFELPVVIGRVIARPVFERVVAVDFGNSNTYVATAISESEAARGQATLANQFARLANISTIDKTGLLLLPLLGDLEAATTEEYPTVIYYTEWDPPKYLVGHKAMQAATERGESTRVIGGLKRGLSLAAKGENSLRSILVGDRQVTVPIETIIEHFLLGVLSEASWMLRADAVRMALAYPVKFGEAEIKKLTKISEDVHKKLSPVGFASLIDAPNSVSTDEATVVALDHVTSTRLIERLGMPDKNGRIHSEAVVAALDLGGGSLDYAILKIEVRGRKNFNKVKTQLLFCGGDSEFGGDNMTVACMELLEDRIVTLPLFQGKSNVAIRRADPNSQRASDLQMPEFAFENFRRLWFLAEAVKRKLCLSATEKKGDVIKTALADNLLESLRDVINSLTVTFDDPNGSKVNISFIEFKEQVAETDLSNVLSITLDDLYRHPIRADLRGYGKYSIRSRLNMSIKELHLAASRLKLSIQEIVLAGAASRLPLVSDLLRAEFQNENIPPTVYLKPNPKSSVARGLVWYHDLGQQDIEVERPLDKTRHAIGIRNSYREFVEVIPICSNTTSAARYPIQDLEVGDSIELEFLNWSPKRPILEVYSSATPSWSPRRQDTGNVSSADFIGYFHTIESENILRTESNEKLPLDMNMLGTCFCQLHLDGAEKRIVLTLSHDGEDLGAWLLKCEKPPVD